MVRMTLVAPPEGPTDEEIMNVLELSVTSSGQLCDRLRNLFEGRDIYSGEKLLTEMQQRVYEVNQANGWFDENRTLGDGIALIHSEISEMFEAYRDSEFRDTTAEYTGHAAEFPNGLPPLKPEGFGSECADVLVRILDESFRQKWTLDWPTLQRTAGYGGLNYQDSVGAHISYMHSLTVDIGNDGQRAINNLLSYLVTWCRVIEGVHLQEEFERKLAYNATRGHKHGGKLL